MPLDKYFQGSGRKVMSAMKRRYGSKAGERIFYATAHKRKKEAFGKAAHIIRKSRRKA